MTNENNPRSPRRKPQEKKSKDPQDSPFTLDEKTSTNLAEVPSITRLLNRKKLALPSKAPPVVAAPEPQPVEPDPTHKTQATRDDVWGTKLKIRVVEPPASRPLSPPASIDEMPSLAAPTATPVVKIQPATRRNAKSAQNPLIHWQMKQLQHGQDPLGHAIAYLFNKGANSALFLALRPAEAEAKELNVPHFHASAYTGSDTKLALWKGLKWDPSITPSLWNYFVKAGYIELCPPGTSTSEMSHRNLIRSAFGITGSEWLLILRVGPGDGCRGVVVIVSSKSLLASVDPALKLLGTRVAALKAA